MSRARLAAGELHLLPAQDHRVAPELAHPDLERRPRPRRGLGEHQRHRRGRRAPGAGGETPSSPRARASSDSSSPRGQLGAGEEVTGHGGGRVYGGPVALRVLTWNLFHGRAVPRGRTGADARNSPPRWPAWSWDVALLQEVPPWWPGATRGGARGRRARQVLTSRNAGLPLRRAVAIRAPGPDQEQRRRRQRDPAPRTERGRCAARDQVCSARSPSAGGCTRCELECGWWVGQPARAGHGGGGTPRRREH